MTFFFLSVVLMLFGRQLGWALSRSVLYSASDWIAGLLACGWGALVAAAIRGLIDWQSPGAVLRWIMGYALGLYVAVPNFGSISEDSVPIHARERHNLVSLCGPATYVLASVAASFFSHH
jgi:hypothetical protein